MSQTKVNNVNKNVPQLNAVEQQDEDFLERLREEKNQHEQESHQWGQEQAREYVKDASYLELKEIVERSAMPEDWGDIRDGIRENGYDEGQAIQGFLDEAKEVFENI